MKTILYATFCSLITVLIAAPQMLAQDTVGIPAELQDLPERWQQAMEDLQVPGLAVVVVRGDKVIYQGTFGHRDPHNELPVTPDTMFYVASCTKTYIATAVMQLVEQGHLDLDDSVKDYLPDFELADQHVTSSVTIRDLLTHALGLDNTPIVFLDAYSGEITEPRYYRWLREVAPADEPQYSNVHYTLLGRVIESVAGRSWKDVLADSIFEPAGMTASTAYASQMYDASDVALPMQIQDGKIVPASVRKSNSTMHAAGGMGTSIHDLSRWLRLHLNGGAIDGRQILSPDNIAEMQRLQTEGQGGAPGIPNMEMKGFGLSWFVTTYKDQPLLQHGGGYIGASAMIAIMPEEQLGIAAVSNATGVLPQLVVFDVIDKLQGLEGPDLLPMVKQMTSRFHEQTAQTLEELGPNPSVDGLSLPANSYAGLFQNEDWGSVQIHLREDGHIALGLGELPCQMGSTGMDRFALLRPLAQPDEGAFETEDGRVIALTIEFSDYPGPVRFERKWDSPK
ncbi:MAG: serine hydrolase [Pirellulaceae bacterium]